MACGLQISKGAGEQLMSRDVRFLGGRLDFFRAMSFYATGGCVCVCVVGGRGGTLAETFLNLDLEMATSASSVVDETGSVGTRMD